MVTLFHVTCHLSDNFSACPDESARSTNQLLRFSGVSSLLRLVGLNSHQLQSSTSTSSSSSASPPSPPSGTSASTAPVDHAARLPFLFLCHLSPLYCLLSFAAPRAARDPRAQVVPSPTPYGSLSPPLSSVLPLRSAPVSVGNLSAASSSHLRTGGIEAPLCHRHHVGSSAGHYPHLLRPLGCHCAGHLVGRRGTHLGSSSHAR